MALINTIQTFLQNKIQKGGLSRKVFARESKIPYTTVNKMINALQLNPDILTIIKIANYFNCSIDEVVGRKFKDDFDAEENNFVVLQSYKFNDTSLNQINLNLKNFIISKLQQYNLNPYKLGRQIGFSEHPVIEFIQENSKRKKLSSGVIVALADYFEVSIDEMIGRISPSNSEPQVSEKVKPKTE